MGCIFRYIGLMVCILSLFYTAPGNSVEFKGNKILTLDEAYERALENSEDILIGLEEIEKSKLFTGKANALMLPHLNLYGQYTKYDNPI